MLKKAHFRWTREEGCFIYILKINKIRNYVIDYVINEIL